MMPAERAGVSSHAPAGLGGGYADAVPVVLSVRELMIRFGTLSIVLLIGAVHGLIVASLLLAVRENRVANCFLAALLVVFALRISPYIIGFAGFYDAYPWLSFAPWQLSLAAGPLIYLYVRQLGVRCLPERWGIHFLPVLIQFSYYALIFPRPLAEKNDWDLRVHEPFIDPVETLLSLLSITAYLVASIRQYRRYQQWLTDHSSRREDFHLEWVRNFLIGLSLTLLLWTGLTLFEWFVVPLTYFQRFPFYAWLTVLVYYLGTEGWRHAKLAFPAIDGVECPAPANEGDEDAAAHLRLRMPATPAILSLPDDILHPADPSEGSAGAQAPRDWTGIAERWLAQINAGEWWRDPDLSLNDLARRLGTNTNHLSRALNDGLGESFSGLVGRLRVEAVKSRLSDPDECRDLLTLALDAGFSSKASFNRVFKTVTGSTPTEFRASVLGKSGGRSR